MLLPVFFKKLPTFTLQNLKELLSDLLSEISEEKKCGNEHLHDRYAIT